jgi:hypothetical protein
MNTCRVCGEAKPEDRFERLPSGNRRKVCRECITAQKKAKPDFQYRRRLARLKHMYGVLPEDYERMFTEQEGACAICRKVVDYPLFVDHCHNSLAVRGLLCKPCNTAIGLFEDNPEFLNSAIRYLEGRRVQSE